MAKNRKTVEQMLQENDLVKNDLLAAKSISDRLSQHGFRLTVVRHDGKGRSIHPGSDNVPANHTKNPGSRSYWEKVHRLCKERSLSVEEARQVLRDRKSRLQSGGVSVAASK